MVIDNVGTNEWTIELWEGCVEYVSRLQAGSVIDGVDDGGLVCSDGRFLRVACECSSMSQRGRMNDRQYLQ